MISGYQYNQNGRQAGIVIISVFQMSFENLRLVYKAYKQHIFKYHLWDKKEYQYLHIYIRIIKLCQQNQINWYLKCDLL